MVGQSDSGPEHLELTLSQPCTRSREAAHCNLADRTLRTRHRLLTTANPGGEGDSRRGPPLRNPSAAPPGLKLGAHPLVSMNPSKGLAAAARAAYSLAQRELGEDARRFRTALLSYAYAVDLRVAGSRLLGARGATVDPGAWRGRRSPAGQGDARDKPVGGAPRRAAWPHTGTSAKRIHGQRRPGRPVGAVSAPDRVALPGSCTGRIRRRR